MDVQKLSVLGIILEGKTWRRKTETRVFCLLRMCGCVSVGTWLKEHVNAYAMMLHRWLGLVLGVLVHTRGQLIAFLGKSCAAFSTST